MRIGTETPIHSIAVALLAVAVIVLAPQGTTLRLQEHNQRSGETTREQTTTPGRPGTRIQRESGQF